MVHCPEDLDRNAAELDDWRRAELDDRRAAVELDAWRGAELDDDVAGGPVGGGECAS